MTVSINQIENALQFQILDFTSELALMVVTEDPQLLLSVVGYVRRFYEDGIFEKWIVEQGGWVSTSSHDTVALI